MVLLTLQSFGDYGVLMRILYAIFDVLLCQKKKKKICVQSADFFRADNPEGMEARNEVNTRN